MTNPIYVENQLAGSTGWIFVNGATTQIQAYADRTSLDPGQTITLYCSTQVASTAYSINIYRLGWYGGLGGRLVATLPGLVGQAQGYFDGTTLQSCPTAIIDSTTHNIDAGWASSTTWTVPNNACSGVYVASFVDANGKQWGVNFVVRGSSGDYAVVRPYTTDNAYNIWGGYSLYTNPTVGVKVSLNRPQGWGDAGQYNPYYYDVPAIHWLEKQGYNIAYLSDIDIHTNAAQLRNFKAYISLGHDEYWTKQMYDGVQAARDAGVSLAFFGANDCFWQMRFENDSNGNPNRTMVCYKVTTAGANLALDPQYGVNNALVTSNWRDAVLNRPESALCGIMYSNNTHSANIAWTVDASPDTTYFAGTGLVAGQSYGSDIVGNEWDKIQTGSPGNIKTIGTTATVPGGGGNDTSNTTTYRAASGALVFASGSLGWAHALDSYRLDASTVAAIPQMQTLMANIMGALKGPVFSQVSL